MSKYPVISLYTGAGGLDLGLELAGFDIRVCVEVDKDARRTLALNRPHWKLAEPGNVHDLSPECILAQSGLKPREAAVVSGGPPCQPFSKSAYWVTGDSTRMADPRSSTLSAFMEVVRVSLPRVVFLENVSGIAYRGKDEGVRLIREELASINFDCGTAYHPTFVDLNAVNYGVPQKRRRIFMVAHREGVGFSEPAPTHGGADGPRFTTAWDAIGDLDEPYWDAELSPMGKWAELLPSIPEGQNYLWHTPRGGGDPLFGWRTRYWSFLLKLAKDQPSWTIQAVPGPATGPFHWRSRLLSIRELSRLQTFPDTWTVSGDRRSAHRQIGNAVPVALGELFGIAFRAQFYGDLTSTELRTIPEHRDNCPRPEQLMPVSTRYESLSGQHFAHPGTGKGPGALLRNKRIGQSSS